MVGSARVTLENPMQTILVALKKDQILSTRNRQACMKRFMDAVNRPQPSPSQHGGLKVFATRCEIKRLNEYPPIVPLVRNTISTISMAGILPPYAPCSIFCHVQWGSGMTYHQRLLRNNRITHVDERAFSAVPALKSLWLDRNLLTELPSAISRLSRLEKLLTFNADLALDHLLAFDPASVLGIVSSGTHPSDAALRCPACVSRDRLVYNSYSSMVATFETLVWRGLTPPPNEPLELQGKQKHISRSTTFISPAGGVPALLPNSVAVSKVEIVEGSPGEEIWSPWESQLYTAELVLHP
ncbi:hypothetical protein EVAR_87856_1 [Eumeta japonica]|uniref:Uncharacterized protein n=1 Tax=Eumeta variegata TaxID=151549 RepID=A0A4C1WXH9_EUMVA|nr:hypothetical protein EVAR_87856_1 [Eumeta japonica]